LSSLLDLHLAQSIERHTQIEDSINMASYDELMRRARAVVPNLRSQIEDDMVGLIKRGEELDAKRAKAVDAHHTAMDADHDALDGFEHELDEFSNALRPSNGGDDGEKVVVSTAEVGKLVVSDTKLEIEEKIGEEAAGVEVPANSFLRTGT